MASCALPPGPGKTSARVLIDLLEYDPRRTRRNGFNLLRDPAPIFRQDQPAFLRRLAKDCHHDLVLKVEQSFYPSAKEQPDIASMYIVASYCRKCLSHFDVIMDYTNQPGKRKPCHQSTNYPLHHFVRDNVVIVGSEPDRYNKVSEEQRFVCSAPECPARLIIRIYLARLDSQMLKLISDPEVIRRRGLDVIAGDQTRYQKDEPMDPVKVLGTLRIYLRDALQKKPEEKKRIAARNKTFLLCFGYECTELLQWLGFQLQREEDGEEFWALPCPPERTGDFLLKTGRTFLEDVLAELSERIVRSSESQNKATPARFEYNPLPAKKQLEYTLGCADYPTHSRQIDLEAEEHPHYAGLGAVGDFNNELLIFAYERQRECDPANRPYYLDCLKGISTGRKAGGISGSNEELQAKVAMILSTGERSMADTDNAYRFFGLPIDTVEEEDFFIATFNSRIDSAPGHKEDAKHALFLIGEAIGSIKLKAVAREQSKMTLSEALDFLGVKADTDSGSIDAMAVVQEMDGDKEKVAQAMSVIAESRPNDTILKEAAARRNPDDHNDTSLGVDEAYRRLQVPTSSFPDSTVLEYYHSLMMHAGPATGSKDSYAEALRVIAKSRNSKYLLAKLENPEAEIDAEKGSVDQPVGLSNIGNTCYLNSLLQYYFTNKVVRDIVMNFDIYRMPLDDEYIIRKRVGGRAVDRGEIIKSQKFVEELSGLFHMLKCASTRSVRPTQDLAELTLFSSATEANFRRASISSPSRPSEATNLLKSPFIGPLLPPPKALSHPPTIEEETDDVEMTGTQDGKAAGNGDDASDTTLVDLEQQTHQVDGNNESVANIPLSNSPVQNPTINPALLTKVLDQEGDATMAEDGNDDVPTLIEFPHLISPERTPEPGAEQPPPVPPRQKPANISTSAPSSEEIRQEKLKFGAQQDVTEVIGNVMFRLHCAIKPTGIDPTFGEQIDSIKDTFYGTTKAYTQKAAGLECKVEDWPNIIVYPAIEGSRDIYEALDVVYDEQIVDVENRMAAQYRSIGKLPHIVQIQIQRTAYDAKTHQASKNQNPVTFDETIFLDRYMDSDHESVLMQRRKEAWRWKERLRLLEARKLILTQREAGLTVAEGLDQCKDFLKSLQEDDTLPLLGYNVELPDALEERTGEIKNELEDIDEEIITLRRKIQEQFTDMRQYRYRLQSVFIHRGTSNHGHYWIYIYDFKNDVWREYNDENVLVVTDRKKVFEPGSSGNGTPYYLVYVRDENKEELVEAVCREMETEREPVMEAADTSVMMEDVGGPSTAADGQGGGFLMEEDQRDADGEEEHVENVDPKEVVEDDVAMI